MTWQEELRKLDEDFSSGNITADEYRVRRDQVLSSAVAPAQQEQPDNGSNAEATQIVSPVQPQQPPQQPPSDAGPEATQMVPPGGDNPDATQIVRGWETQQPSPPYGVPQPDYNSPAGGFPQQPPPSPAGGFPQQQYPPSGGFAQPGYEQQQYGHQPYDQQPAGYEQPQWHSEQQPEEPAPLWGGDEFPPIAPATEPDWVTQGPEFAKEPEEKGNTGKIIGVVLAVLLLAGIAFGAWWLWGRGEQQPTAGGGDPTSEAPAPTETKPPETSKAPEDPLPIAELPGQKEDHPEVKTFRDIPAKNYLNDKELAAYDEAGAGDAKFQVQHLEGDSTATLLLTSASDGKSAKAAVKDLRDIQVSNGAEEAPKPPKGVFVTEFTDQKTKVGEIRAHYVSGNVIVRIEVRSKDGIKSARKEFMEILNAQLEALPADA